MGVITSGARGTVTVVEVITTGARDTGSVVEAITTGWRWGTGTVVEVITSRAQDAGTVFEVITSLRPRPSGSWHLDPLLTVCRSNIHQALNNHRSAGIQGSLQRWGGWESWGGGLKDYVSSCSCPLDGEWPMA